MKQHEGQVMERATGDQILGDLLSGILRREGLDELAVPTVWGSLGFAAQ